MTAIQAMRRELSRIQRAQNECITSYGVVRPFKRYQYQALIEQAKSLRESIDWMEKLYADKP